LGIEVVVVVVVVVVVAQLRYDTHMECRFCR